MNVAWTEHAVSRLEEIRSYIARDSPKNADSMIGRIIETANTLADFPQLGAIVPRYARHGYREILEPPYRIFYRVIGEQVQILTVVHGALRLPRDLS